MIANGRLHALLVRSLATSAACLFFGVCPLAAQTLPTTTTPELPTEPAAWVNSAPYALESVKGKAILFYFFEEQCPKCRGQWPAMLEIAKKHRQDPILFVAVNSGNDRAAVEQYVKSVKLDWPVIVDTDRSFEKAAGIHEISLHNIQQFKYILGNGKIRSGDWRDVDGTITKALQGAAWRIDPTTMPEELLPLWRNVELLQYTQAAKALNKYSSSADPKVKAGAKTLRDAVDEEITTELAAAQASLETDKWEAYKQFDALGKKFAGFPIATEAQTVRKNLVKEPEVKSQLAALKTLDQNRALMNSPKPAVRNRAIANIQKLIADQPESEAAKIAKSLGAGAPQ